MALHSYKIVRYMIDNKVKIKIDAAEPDILSFYSAHSSSFSEPDAYTTHNAAQLQTVQLDIWLS